MTSDRNDRVLTETEFAGAPKGPGLALAGVAAISWMTANLVELPRAWIVIVAYAAAHIALVATKRRQTPAPADR